MEISWHFSTAGHGISGTPGMWAGVFSERRWFWRTARLMGVDPTGMPLDPKAFTFEKSREVGRVPLVFQMFYDSTDVWPLLFGFLEMELVTLVARKERPIPSKLSDGWGFMSRSTGSRQCVGTSSNISQRLTLDSHRHSKTIAACDPGEAIKQCIPQLGNCQCLESQMRYFETSKGGRPSATSLNKFRKTRLNG